MSIHRLVLVIALAVAGIYIFRATGAESFGWNVLGAAVLMYAGSLATERYMK